MKNFIKMALAAMSLCLVVFSCYDDSELREAIGSIKEQVNKLENKVAENVSAIQSMVSLGSVQSCKFDNQTGKAVITLLDGKTIVVDMTVEGLSLISVMEVQGEYYWGICNNGQTTQLLVKGKPVPVTVTPALQISKDNEWQISVDGGKSWVSTGIFNNTQNGNENESTETAVTFFKDVQKDGDYLILTLMDGTPVKVALVGEATFEAAQTEVYFSKEGLEKNITLTEQNLKAYTITEKPEGWKARVDYNSDEDTYTLVITSPEDITAAAQSGTVKILGVFNGGQNPEIVSVDVAYEQAFKLSLGIGTAVNVSIAEHSFEDITGYIVGAVKTSEFSAESVAGWLCTEEGYLSECHMEAKTFEIADLVADYDPTEAYVVYAVEQIPVKLILSGADTYTAKDLQTVTIGSTKAKVGIYDIKYDSAYLSLEFTDMKGYFCGYADLAFWESMGRDNVLESIKVGNMTALTAPLYDGYVNVFPDGIEGTQLLPATDYVVWIMPEAEAEGHEYLAEEFILYTFKTSPIVEDKSIAAPVCNVSDVTYGGFTATVTPAAGAYKTYAAIRKGSAIPEDLIESVTELIDINHYSEGSAAFTVSNNSFEDSDEVYLLAVSVTDKGHFGEVYKQKVDLKPLTFSDDIGVSMKSEIDGLGDVTLTLTFTGDPSTITYYCTSTNYYGDDTLQALLARGQVGDAVCDYQISQLPGQNKIMLSGLTLGVQYTCYAIVKDAAGVPSKISKVSFTPIVLMDYIESTSADYEYGMPIISGKKSFSTYTLQINKPDECVKYWVFLGDFEYMTGSSTSDVVIDLWGATDKLVTNQLESVGALELVDTYNIKYTLRSSTRLYVAWMDDLGRYHMIHTINPNK